MYAGTKVKIGDEEYTIPPISLGQLRNGLLTKLQEHDKLSADGKLFETLQLRGEIILAAIRRNYPDFSEDKLFAHLDLANTSGIWLSILGASGFNSGEAKAVTVGTSSPSTEASPPPTDGPIAR
jgi:hypothetical protein